jgi:hypothetical protein
MIAQGLVKFLDLDRRKDLYVGVAAIARIEDRPEGGVLVHLISGESLSVCGTADSIWAEFLEREVTYLKAAVAGAGLA